jgi:hypothetical protein
MRFLTAAFIAVAISGCAAAPTPAAPPLDTGVVDPDAFLTGNPAAFEHVADSGSSWLGITVLWSTIAPVPIPQSWDPTNPADPNYRFGILDRAVKQAVRAGFTPLVHIVYAPPWAQRCPGHNPAVCDPDPVRLQEFATALARRYSGTFMDLPRVQYYQVLNEPNLHLFFLPQFRDGRPVSPELYLNLVNSFSAGVKGIDPTNVVVTGGLAPLERPGGLGPLDFSRRMLCMVGRRNPTLQANCTLPPLRADVWAVNPYTTGGPTHEGAGPDDVSLGDLAEMRRLLRAAERAGRFQSIIKPVPFWVTEFSWDSDPPDPGALPWKLHARWTSEALYRAWAAGVRTFFWYSIRDSARGGLSFRDTVQSGLYLRGRGGIQNDRPKLALRAFRFPFVAFRRGGTKIKIWGRTPNSRAGGVLIQNRIRGIWRTVGSASADGGGIFERFIHVRGRPRLLRARFGRAESVPFSLRRVRDRYVRPFG